VDNTVIDDSRPVDAASVRSSEHSENGMRVDSNAGGTRFSTCGVPAK